MRSRGPVFVLSLLLLTLFVLTASSFAIPAFTRQYSSSRTTCHIDLSKPSVRLGAPALRAEPGSRVQEGGSR